MFVCPVISVQSSSRDLVYPRWDVLYLRRKKRIKKKSGKCLANENITENTILGVLSKLFSPNDRQKLWMIGQNYIWQITIIVDPLKFISSPGNVM